jgi:hypothetical protein
MIKAARVVILTIAVFLGISGHARLSADNLYQFALFAIPNMEKESCRLVERYSPDKEEMTVFAGYIDEYACNVSVPKERYQTLFQFCYQSGVNVSAFTHGSSFECFLQERKDDFLFLAHISQQADSDAQIMCYFSCIPRESGK